MYRQKALRLQIRVMSLVTPENPARGQYEV